jgi:hypothetical protein
VIYFGSYDCHAYALGIDGELVWKFPTSLSYQSPVNIEGSTPEKQVEFVLKLGEQESNKRNADDATLADYGEFSGTYVDTTKTDYLGLKKRGYVK